MIALLINTYLMQIINIITVLKNKINLTKNF